MGLVWINTWVNETIKPLTDVEHWGVADHWSYP
jgi:predicted transglutaminase-like cysteine proteinase